ncbi:hypothetical protein AB0N17_03090 [Streptomyces sp. NPDC051133]|uniref:hypothetical protein n=1 Tax=Streptomyces sp. NPDC051133 TaxID=3155521 RepID=UPI0034405B63
MTVLLLFAAAVLGAAALLHAVAPRRTPLLYLGPAARTAALIAAATAYVAIIWSH